MGLLCKLWQRRFDLIEENEWEVTPPLPTVPNIPWVHLGYWWKRDLTHKPRKKPFHHNKQPKVVATSHFRDGKLIKCHQGTTNLPSGQGSNFIECLFKKNPAPQAEEFWGSIQNGFPPLVCVGLDVIILGVSAAAEALHGFASGQQTSTYFAGQQDLGKSSKTSAYKDKTNNFDWILLLTCSW